MRKSLLISFYSLLIFVSILSLSASAYTIPGIVPGGFIDNINRLTSLIRPIITTTFTGIFASGGYMWMTAGDDKDKVKKAGNILVTALVGLIIVFIAPSAGDLVASIFGIKLFSFL